MKFIIKSAIVVMVSMFFSMSVFAEASGDSSSVDNSQVNAAQALVEKVTKHQLEVIETFSGPGNLIGFLLQPPQGKPLAMYADHDGNFVVYGALINKEGVNVSEQDTAKYSQPYLSKKISESLGQATYFTEGEDTAKYKMYAVFDPNCSACHTFYTQTEPLVTAGDLQIRWIPVYFLKPSSKGRAAAILAGTDSVSAMAQNEENFVGKTEDGGIDELKDIPENIEAQLQANMKFFGEAGLNSTPTLIYWDADSKLQSVAGFPRDFDGFLENTQPTIQDSE